MTKPLIFALFFLLTPLQLQAATDTNQYITMNIPEAVIAEAMKQILPVPLPKSRTVSPSLRYRLGSPQP